MNKNGEILLLRQNLIRSRNFNNKVCPSRVGMRYTYFNIV